jgi:hypothetical protein
LQLIEDLAARRISRREFFNRPLALGGLLLPLDLDLNSVEGRLAEDRTISLDGLTATFWTEERREERLWQ